MLQAYTGQTALVPNHLRMRDTPTLKPAFVSAAPEASLIKISLVARFKGVSNKVMIEKEISASAVFEHTDENFSADIEGIIRDAYQIAELSNYAQTGRHTEGIPKLTALSLKFDSKEIEPLSLPGIEALLHKIELMS